MGHAYPFIYIFLVWEPGGGRGGRGLCSGLARDGMGCSCSFFLLSTAAVEGMDNMNYPYPVKNRTIFDDWVVLVWLTCVNFIFRVTDEHL